MKKYILLITLFFNSLVFAIPPVGTDGFYQVNTPQDFMWCVNTNKTQISIQSPMDFTSMYTATTWPNIDLHGVTLQGNGHTLTLPTFPFINMLSGGTVLTNLLVTNAVTGVTMSAAAAA